MAKRQLTALTTDKMTKMTGFSREEYEQRIRALQATAPVMIPIQQIVRRPPFSNLFPINPETSTKEERRSRLNRNAIPSSVESVSYYAGSREEAPY